MRLRSGMVLCVLLAALLSMTVSPAAGQTPGRGGELRLVRSYDAPAGGPAAGIGRRGWTYDTALVAAADAATGRHASAARLLDQLAALQLPDGALEFSYDLRTGDGEGPRRSGAMAWVGLAALQYRGATGSRRFDGLLDGVVRWLLARRNADGLITGGPDVRWVSTEHNLEARAVFAGAGGLDDVVARMDAAIDRELFVRDGAGRAHLRQGAGDDVRPVDVQAFGILWLLGQGRAADAAAVADEADRTLRVSGRTLAGIRGRFDGYRPFADAGTPDLIWMEGTLQMRLALAALARDTDALDDSVDRWAALTGPDMLRHSERAAGEDYNVWPAAAPAAWLRLSRSSFALLR